MSEKQRRKSKRQAVVMEVSLPTIADLLANIKEQDAQTYPPLLINRPVGPREAKAEDASFIDPTVELIGADNISVGQHVYLAPFAQLMAHRAQIWIGKDSNIQANARIFATFERDIEDVSQIEASGLALSSGIMLAEGTIVSHGAVIKGPAVIGTDPAMGPVWIQCGAEIDGAILESNTLISILSRVGPGVRLKSGMVVLPGKNVTTQAEADDAKQGKVRKVTDSELAALAKSVEYNLSQARAYTAMFYNNGIDIYGINYQPGKIERERKRPTLNGERSQVPYFRNRIIGEVIMADSLEQIEQTMARQILLQADDGGVLIIGHIQQMEDKVMIHAQNDSTLTIGNGVSYARHVIIYSEQDQSQERSVIIEDNVSLAERSIICASQLGKGVKIGEKSAIITSEIMPGTIIPDHVIYLDGLLFGSVEW